AIVVYTLTQENDAEPVWKVSMRGTGFRGGIATVRLKLESWGGWLDIDEYYLRNLQTKPAGRGGLKERGSFVLQPPPDWGGAFDVAYVLPLARVGSSVQQRLGLLPSWNEYATCGFSANTLMHVDAGKRTVRRTIHVVPPKGATVATGWGGVTQGEQRSI